MKPFVIEIQNFCWADKFWGVFSRTISSAVASGWAGWALAHPEFQSLINPLTTRGGGQIMPTTLLLAHPDLKTQRHL